MFVYSKVLAKQLDLILTENLNLISNKLDFI